MDKCDNHSTGYSMIGYNATMLRAYHPLEFTTAYLNRADNEEDINMGTELAKQRGITIHPIKFRYSRAKYAFVKETNSIYKGLESVKFLSINVADELFKLRNNRYNSFYDLLVDLKINTSLNSRQLMILISLNYFSEFGNNKKLLEFSELFNELYNIKQLNKTKAEKLNIPIDLAQKYSRETAKTYMDFDYNLVLRDLWNRIKDSKLSIREQVQAEMEYLGYVEFIEARASDDFYIVTEFKTYKNKHKPYIKLRRLNNGENIKTKVVDPKFFKWYPFELYSVLKIKEFSTQKKSRLINNQWQKTDEDEQVLTEWQVL